MNGVSRTRGRAGRLQQQRDRWSVVFVRFAIAAIVLAGLGWPAAASSQRGRAFGRSMQAPRAQAPAPVERRPPGGAGANDGRGLNGGHLAQWMNQHSDMTLQQQQQALRREPGFSELPQATQQRYMQRLSQLNAMPSAQRQRVLARNEWMEHLSPDQRAQVRGATEQLGALPPDQRRVVAQSFRQLRDLPPEQREAAMNSDRYRGQMNPAQFDTLRNLMRIEPMLPPK